MRERACSRSQSGRFRNREKWVGMEGRKICLRSTLLKFYHRTVRTLKDGKLENIGGKRGKRRLNGSQTDRRGDGGGGMKKDVGFWGNFGC